MSSLAISRSTIFATACLWRSDVVRMKSSFVTPSSFQTCPLKRTRRVTPTASTSSEPNDGSCPHYRQDLRFNQVAYNSPMQRVTCDACGRVVPAHAHYVVRIDVFADPAMPQTTSEEL